MATGESVMEEWHWNIKFLMMVLDQGNELLEEGSVTDEYKGQVKS